MTDKEFFSFIQALIIIWLVTILTFERDKAVKLQQEVDRLNQQIECRNECAGTVNE